MGVFKDKKNGGYFVQIDYKDAVTGKRRFKKKRFKLLREANEYEAKLKLELNTSKSSILFCKLADEYIDSMNARQYNKDYKRNALINHCQAFYELPMDKISKPLLVQWSNELKTSSLAVRTVNAILSYVKSVFKYGHNVYDIKDISTIITRKPKQSTDTVEMQVWTVDQFNKFINHVQGEYYKAFFYVLFWTGLRRGECLALQVEDFDGRSLNISKSIRYDKHGFTPLKNANSKRKVLLDGKTIKIIKKCLEMAKNGFIFGGVSPLKLNALQKVFDAAILNSGVPKIRIHDLRHSHATLLINNGVNIVAVSKRLGHSDVNITLKTYTHLLKKTEKELIDKIEILSKK